MTAVNVVVDSAVHIVTDSICYIVVPPNPDQGVACFCPKVETLPHLPAVLAMSGPGGVLQYFAEIIYSAATDLDELMASPAIRSICATTLAEGLNIRAVVAGHSPTIGPAAWYLAGDRFEPIGAGAFYLSPNIDGFVPKGDSDPVAFEASLIELMELQRRSYPVGGAAILTSVRPSGITQKILNRWPDRIGDVLRADATAAH
jgi:hypothetical protein